jgi:hypothetical protein
MAVTPTKNGSKPPAIKMITYIFNISAMVRSEGKNGAAPATTYKLRRQFKSLPEVAACTTMNSMNGGGGLSRAAAEVNKWWLMAGR